MDILNSRDHIDIKTKIMSFLGNVTLIYMSRVNKTFYRIYKSEKLKSIKNTQNNKLLRKSLKTFRGMIECKNNFTIPYDFFCQIPYITDKLSNILDQLPDPVYKNVKLLIALCMNNKELVINYMKYHKVPILKHWIFFIKLRYNKDVTKLYKECRDTNMILR